MWKFTVIRQLTIKHMSLLTIDAVEKILLARAFHVPRWLLPALGEYAKKKHPITTSDVHHLGLDTILKIIHLREQTQDTSLSSSGQRYICEANRRTTCDFTNALRTAFKSQIRQIKNPVRTTTLPDGSEFALPEQQSDIVLCFQFTF
jgi:hypothetical protein